jgi:murein L,D-transpeptidase YafK
MAAPILSNQLKKIIPTTGGITLARCAFQATSPQPVKLNFQQKDLRTHLLFRKEILFMKRFATVAILAVLPLISACQKAVDHQPDRPSAQKVSYQPPDEITGILIKKSEGEMALISNGRKVREYEIDLGFAPEGDKKMQGDGKTPEGTYYIDRKNPQSQFYLSLGISYPNEADRAEARAMGVSPGGDIFIHGQGRYGQGKSGIDWTWGCIAVTDIEMQEVFALVDIGTPVTILP